MSSPKSEVSFLPRPASTSEEVQRALILVVERNPAVQLLEKFFLEQAGYTGEFASDGLSALSRAREFCPHILVTEILVFY